MKEVYGWTGTLCKIKDHLKKPATGLLTALYTTT